MSAFRITEKCSPFNPSAASMHISKYDPDLSEFSASYTSHQVKPKFTPKHASMKRNQRSSDSVNEGLLASATHRDFIPHSALDKSLQPQVINTRASAMNHLDPSKTFSNVTNSDEIYRSEKSAKFKRPGMTTFRASPQPPSRLFPTQEFHDSTTSRDYCSHDLSKFAPKHVFASGQPSSIASTSENAKFASLSTSAHDYPNHAPQPVRPAFQAPRSTTNQINNNKPLEDNTLHKQFFIPHKPGPSLSTAPPPIYRKEPLEFFDETAYNHFYNGHRNVPLTAKYHPIPGNLFSSLPSDMNTQTSIHYPPKHVTPYFAPVPITYSAPTAPLIDDTSQRIDFPAYHSLTQTTSAKPKLRPITGEFYSTTTTASLHKPLLLSDRPAPAVDKHGISLPRGTFYNNTTTRSTYQGTNIAREKPIVPKISKTVDLSGIPLEHNTIYKHSYNYPRPVH